jgi:cell division protease FtsH
MKKLKIFLKARIADVRRLLLRCKRGAINHRALAVITLSALICFSIIGENAVVDIRSNASTVLRLQNLPSTNQHELAQEIENDNVAKIIIHKVDAGTFFSPETKRYAEIVLRKTKKGKANSGVPETRHGILLDVSSLGLSFWEGIDKLAEKHSFVQTQGYHRSANPLYMWAQQGVVVLTLIMVFLFAQMLIGEVISGHSFKPQKRDLDINLENVVGYAEIKRELREVMDQLKRARYFADRGVVAPRGILFTGDPGVGKTMMAKAMANELGAEFFYCTGADFAEMYVGVGPRRVRSLFKRARQTSIAIIFIDEIDAIGSRSAMGNDSERQATINQLLAEMDGVNGNGRVLVLGATNHAGLLDAALLRPGRFDRKIHVPLPDAATRRAILARYLEKVEVAPDVNLEALAQRTQGYSGAQLHALVAEAKNLALRESENGQVIIFHDTLAQAQEIAILGISTQNADPAELHRVAVHELGHALIGHLCCDNIMVEKVTLLGRGMALGYTLSRPLNEHKLKSQESLRGDVMMCLGGRAAEEVMMQSVSSGAQDDLVRANGIVRMMVCDLGMGKTTGLRVVARSMDPGAALPATADEDVRMLLGELYDNCLKIIKGNQGWMETRTSTLLEEKLLAHDALFSEHDFDAWLLAKKSDAINSSQLGAT